MDGNFVVEMEHPQEAGEFMRAIIDRNEVEFRYGLGSFGNPAAVREFPRYMVEALAYAEERVLEAQANLREKHGITREMDRETMERYRAGLPPVYHNL